MAIQSIETRYAGCRFRSRLEARWAVFLTTLGIRWEHEPQGYVLNGTPYLPDFRLHLSDGTSLFAEVKGDADEFEGEHVDLCRALADGTATPVLLLIGPPAYRMYHRFTKGLDADSFQAAFFNDHEPKVTTADSYWFQYVQPNPETGAPEFPHDDAAAKDSFGPGLVLAVTAARSARFEHGEAA